MARFHIVPPPFFTCPQPTFLQLYFLSFRSGTTILCTDTVIYFRDEVSHITATVVCALCQQFVC
jgi:hypothetical protein